MASGHKGAFGMRESGGGEWRVGRGRRAGGVAELTSAYLKTRECLSLFIILKKRTNVVNELHRTSTYPNIQKFAHLMFRKSPLGHPGKSLGLDFLRVCFFFKLLSLILWNTL